MVPLPSGGDFKPILEYYRRYLKDPSSVPIDWAIYFEETQHSNQTNRKIAYSETKAQSILDTIKTKAKDLGVKEIYIENLQEEFVRDYVFPMLRANTLYEGCYLLGTAIARPLIAKRQIEIAKEVGADAVAHGATGKGNDQVRFELAFYANNPNIKVIAPWRDWEFNSREDLLNFARLNQIKKDDASICIGTMRFFQKPIQK